MNRDLEKYYDDNADKYFDLQEGDGLCFQKYIQFPAIQEMLEKLNFDSILDVGCGTGLYTKYFSDTYGDSTQITAIDQSKGVLSIAQEHVNNSNVNFIHGDILEHNFGNEKFDIIFVSFVVNYLNKEEFQSFLEKCRILLSENGRIINTMLHPYYTSSVREGDCFIFGNYHDEGLYPADFLDLNNPLMLHKYKFETVINVINDAKIEVEMILEPSCKYHVSCPEDFYNFYSRLYSIIIMSLVKSYF